MIHYVTGNLLRDSADAVVNTVNELGVMGKGVALQFKEAYPDSADEYMEAAKKGRVRVGHIFVTQNSELLGPRWILHFPTKRHWRQPSDLAWIRSGLRDLARVIDQRGIRSIALPPVGCGNGGLEWTLVRAEIEGALAGLPGVEVRVYEPTYEYLGRAKRAGTETLTPARALIAELVRRYSIVALECSLLEIQKLAWFVHRVSGEHGVSDPLSLKFSAHRYGPYDDRLRHLLESLDGSYLHAEKRIADAKPYDHIWFDQGHEGKLTTFFADAPVRPYQDVLDEVTDLIRGFESPLGLELLATVDWLLHSEAVGASVSEVRTALRSWSGGKKSAKRKLDLFDDALLELALGRLGQLRRRHAN